MSMKNRWNVATRILLLDRCLDKSSIQGAASDLLKYANRDPTQTGSKFVEAKLLSNQASE